LLFENSRKYRKTIDRASPMDYKPSMDAPIAVVESDEFLAATRKLMHEDERAALVDYLARNP